VTARRDAWFSLYGDLDPPVTVSEIAVLTLVHDGVLVPGQPCQGLADSAAHSVGQSFALVCQAFTAANEARLRESVFLFVARAKAISLPPERVLIATKSAISAVGGGRPPSLSDSLGNSGNTARQRAYRRVFQWILEAYFG
jgi:hypothetical protein